ncbi:MAG TPA: ABC transporter ATP-binding protein [Stellaceae bacterium]|nr:ABC transporter ATP-binding protein [Stellaceae bacterium]
MSEAAAAVELRGIDKRFAAVQANRKVSLSLARGTIHGLIGENGAGKSTLAGILYGYLTPDAGEIRMDGRPVAIRNPRDAMAAGIGMVHQHFMLVDSMTVLENLVLGQERGLTLARGEAAARATLASFARGHDARLDPDMRVEALPVGLKQRVEILKALHRGAEILILDEPTAVLTPIEVRALFDELRALARAGKTILLVTHKLKEVMAITDVVTVMRQGAVVGQYVTKNTNPAELAALMIGRAPHPPAKSPAAPGAPVLAVEAVTLVDPDGIRRLDGVSLSVRAGEIVGVAGVAGNGQSELIEALVGLRPVRAGTIRLAGIDATSLSVAARRRLGLGHLAEDRLRLGAIAAFSATENALLGRQGDAGCARWGLLRRTAVRDTLDRWMRAYDIRPRDPEQRLTLFSGGNQQKLVVARELERGPAVLVVGQPTRGIDVGAAESIHARLLALRAEGVGILLISADLDEIRLLSDRILVMCDGRIAGEVTTEAADERRLSLLMAGSEAA